MAAASWRPFYRQVTQPRTVPAVLAEIGPRHRPELQRAAARLGLAYPPPALTLVGYKRENVLEVWARADETAGSCIGPTPCSRRAAGPAQAAGRRPARCRKGCTGSPV